ncbi:hypothetical protein AMECASPLE_015261 [Ameca splendens]|uniref:Uncharacterized protein n=1 Tax=Ameca splendens TaxID=208324 RepID=A0ABV0ZZY7_9TELE
MGETQGQSNKSSRQLQLIQNAAARVFSKTKKVEHITSVLKSCHWLAEPQGMDFKIILRLISGTFVAKKRFLLDKYPFGSVTGCPGKPPGGTRPVTP